jgi:hypothetical protein
MKQSDFQVQLQQNETPGMVNEFFSQYPILYNTNVGDEIDDLWKMCFKHLKYNFQVKLLYLFI